MQVATVHTPRQKLVGRRYLLDRCLGNGGMGVVFRAVDRLTGQAVALKQVGAIERDRSIEARLSLAREFQTLASLRHPNVISVLDYGFDEDGRPYFTMDLLEDARTILEAAVEQPIEAKIELIAQMLQALSYLHRQGVVHRDIKPGNVLVADGCVRVLDFGLCTPAMPRLQQREGQGLAWGTLFYMAPEIRRGLAPTEAADLYAAGVIAFQILTGRRPFSRDGPDTASAGLPARLTRVLDRLLATAPEERCPSAQEALVSLSEAAGLSAPSESAAIRDSFTRAARLVGRERELEILLDALEQARSGRGSAWLVGGESGVGKSRLLSEVRTRALVSSALVLQGQSTAEGGGPYQVFRDVVRWLCLLAAPTDLEAGVLLDLVPDIATLLDRPVIPACELDPESARARLLSTIEALGRRLARPVVLILEDLQWAGDESLAVVQRLQRAAAELPIVVLASYRDDEAPELPRLLPGAVPLRLERLGEESVAELSEAMLGPDGRRPEIVRLLMQQTEGNVFFLVEMVRALAEHAGALESAATSAPAHCALPPCVQQILRGRLGRLPAEVRPWLRLAAVAGRELDLAVLARMGARASLDAALTRCIEGAVLAARQGRICFAHDKLRDAVLEDLSPLERCALHGRIARLIEESYPGAAEHVAALAYHWGMAGEEGMEARYRALAGERALHVGAYREAADSLERALILKAMGGSKAAAARLERQLGEAYFGLGDMAASRRWLERSVRCGRGPGQGGAAALEAARAYERLAHVYFFENLMPLVVYASLRAFSAAGRAGRSPELAEAYANLSVAVGLVPLRRLARALAQRARNVAKAVRDERALAWVDQLEGVYRGGLGEWTAARGRLEIAMEAWRRLGHRRRWEETLALQGMVAFHQGDAAAADDLRRALHKESLASDSRQAQGWALIGLAEGALRAGEAASAIDLLGTAASLQGGIRQVEQIWLSGLLARAQLCEGRAALAEGAARAGMDLIARSFPTAFYAFEGYSGVAEALLQAWEGSPGAERRMRRGPARRAVQALARFARVFPIARPRALLWQGREEWLCGRRGRAQETWHRALAAAGRLGMAYEAGLIHHEMGRRMQAGSELRERHLRFAEELFTIASAPGDARRVHAQRGGHAAGAPDQASTSAGAADADAPTMRYQSDASDSPNT